jgi:hypothetical protein
LRLLLHKLGHWEYWPFQIVYIPISMLWIYYAIKTRSLFFFNASNPTIKNGGFMMESKKAIYNLIPQHYYPKTELIIEGTPFVEILKTIENSGIQFPFIAKPDIGLRGSAVKKIHNIKELASYNSKADFDYLVQSLIPFENEVGIFYVRYPNEKLGRITGIVSKEFMIVTGDGVSTTEELIKKDARYELQLKALRLEYGKILLNILPKGEKLNLVPYGNHARGAKFIDGSHWIVELNGAASEPTHIYDPKHSIFFAWNELARHITYMYEISVQNHKKGSPYLAHKEGMKEYRLHLEQSKKIVNF